VKEGVEMELLFTGGAFLGAVVGRFFRILVLLPICTVAVALLFVNCELAERTLSDSLVRVGLLVGALELGYVTGVISTDISEAAQRLRLFRTRLRSRHM
jgi:hypothetical protein